MLTEKSSFVALFPWDRYFATVPRAPVNSKFFEKRLNSESFAILGIYAPVGGDLELLEPGTT